jgi:hypothetical protein
MTDTTVKNRKRETARKKALKNLQVGDLAPDGSRYMGVWEPKDKDGKGLGKTFHIFANPHLFDGPDVAELKTNLAALKKDGPIHSEMSLALIALKSGDKWFIPTEDLPKGTFPERRGPKVRAVRKLPKPS